MILWAAGQIQI